MSARIRVPDGILQMLWEAGESWGVQMGGLLKDEGPSVRTSRGAAM